MLKESLLSITKFTFQTLTADDIDNLHFGYYLISEPSVTGMITDEDFPKY